MKVVEHRITGKPQSGKTTSMVLQAKAFSAAGMKCLYVVPSHEMAHFYSRTHFSSEVQVNHALNVDLSDLKVGCKGGFGAVFFDDVDAYPGTSKREIEAGLKKLKADSDGAGFVQIFIAVTDNPVKPL
ncbi:hypothetical protein [Marinobacterium sp. BA1]|uniref:hypothetical protein n=1 Tax=Marinobacterium sp. BA1 TaxID=3138931 RepID=UPI0032E5B816